VPHGSSSRPLHVLAAVSVYAAFLGITASSLFAQTNRPTVFVEGEHM